MIKSLLLVSAVQALAVAGAAAATPPSAMQAPTGVTRMLGPSNSPYTAATAKEFAQACKLDESSCSAMVGQVLMDRIQFSPTSHICLPGITYADQIAPWLEAHPEVASLNAREGIYRALTTIYKCGPPNNY